MISAVRRRFLSQVMSLGNAEIEPRVKLTRMQLLAFLKELARSFIRETKGDPDP